VFISEVGPIVAIEPLSFLYAEGIWYPELADMEPFVRVVRKHQKLRKEKEQAGVPLTKWIFFQMYGSPQTSDQQNRYLGF